MSTTVKKKQVRFANMEDEEQDEDTLFDRRRAANTPGRPRGDGACARWTVTLVLCASFLGLGMSISVLGPTLEDLALNVGKNIGNISYIFVGRSAGYIGGSLLGGILFDWMSPYLLLGVSLLLTAGGMVAIPVCRQALVVTGLMATIGMSMGVLDTGGNVLILNTWGDRSGPHMQALHFSFAAGAFASPIIAKLLFGAPAPAPAPAPPEPQPLLSFIHSRGSMWAYVVIGAFLLVLSLVFLVLHCVSSRVSRDRASGGRPQVARHHRALVVLLFFFFFAYVGAEVAYGSFIFTLAKDYAGMEQAQAAGLNSLFWATFAACRGAAILFATCMSPGSMILLSLVGCTLSSLLLCLFSRQTLCLWLGTGLYGASMACTFPSGISWLEQYTTVSGHTASVFVLGAALGEMVLPAGLGALLGLFPEQPLLMYLSLGAATFGSILFPVMYKLASAPGGAGRKPRGHSEDSEYRQALLDSGANEEEEDNEADLWNDADFEVIEMDDSAAVLSSPSRAALPDVAVLPAASQQAASPSGSLPADSPRRRPLLPLDREKRD